MKNTHSIKLAGLFRRYPMVFLMAALAIVVCGAAFGRDKKLPAEETSTRMVRSFTVVSAQGGVVEYTGVIHARTESDLGFRVSGKILEKLVKSGDHVKRGQALMQLDPTDLRLAANSAQAAVEAARAQNKRALSDELRQRELAAIKAVSVQEYEQAKSAADATTAQLNSAIAYSKQMENQVHYAVLRADSDGVVMETPADVGQVVGPGNVVLRLAHDGAREAVINLPEGNTRLAKSMAVARLYADAGQSFPAELRELSAMADPLTRTYQARYSLDGAGKNAPLGATVTVQLGIEADKEAEQQYEIPVSALYDGGAGASVWVIDPDTSTLSRRQVEVARLGSETALVSNSLSPGERILALGAHLVREGERVTIISEPVKEQSS